MSLMIQQLHFHKPDGLSLSLMITAISLPILISPLNFHIQTQRFSLFCCITFLQTACFNSTASSDSLHWLESTTCMPFVLQSSLFAARNWRPPKRDSAPHAEESVWGWAVVPYRQGDSWWLPAAREGQSAASGGGGCRWEGGGGGGREENSERDRDGEEAQFRWKKKTNPTQPLEGRTSRSCLRAALMRRCPWHMWQPLTESDWGFIKTVAVFLPRYRVRRRLTGTVMEEKPTWGCTRLNPLFGFHLLTEIVSNLE